MRPALKFTSVSGAAIVFSANTDKKTKDAKKKLIRFNLKINCGKYLKIISKYQ